MKLINFMKENKDWETQLDENGIKVVWEEKLVLLKYDHINTNFNYEFAEYCRGCVIDTETMEYVCHPFKKFWNLHEGRCAKMDWTTAEYQDKLDGSIMKLWFYKGEWRVSTNGVIFAENADIYENGFGVMSFGELFDKTWKDEGYDKSILSKGSTYVFELCTPVNRVVVKHEEFKLYFLGQFENSTAKEIIPISHQFRTFKTHKFKNGEEAKRHSETLKWDEEGYVVVDKYGNRCKIKGLAYLALHRMVENNLYRMDSIYDIIASGEKSEVLTYFPEITVQLEELEARMISFKEGIQNSLIHIRDNFTEDMSRKDKAKWICENCPNPSYGFRYMDGLIKIEEVGRIFLEVPYKKMIQKNYL